MKKIMPLLLCLVFLTSCNKTGYTEIESRAIISSIGVDKTTNGIAVTMEVVNTKNPEELAENQIITKEGKDFLSAVSNISSSLSKNLFYSHCAVVALGENLTQQDVQSIFKFIFSGNEFTLLLKVIATKNAKELLNVTPQSEAVLGYEIMSALSSRQKNLSLGYYNSFINVGGRRDVTPYLYALPYFEVTGDEEKIYSISGLKLYKDDLESMVLNKTYSSVFEIFSNSFRSGQISIDIDNLPKTVEIKKSKNTVTAYLENDRLIINFTLTETLKNKEFPVNLADYKQALNKALKEFIAISQEKNLDVFFIKEVLKRTDKTGFNKVNNNFNKYYKSAKFNITLNIKEQSNA